MVSVVVLTYNRSELLKYCLHSILNQTFKNLEVIIIDDGSTDDTSSVIKEINDERLRYFNNGRIKNIPKLLNDGFEKAKYNYVSMCGDDDLWYPNKLEMQLKYMNNYDIVCSGYNVINSNNEFVDNKFLNYTEDSIVTIDKLLTGNFVIASSVLINKNILPSPRPFNEFSLAEDYELWLRLAVKNRFIWIGKKLISFRIHNKNMTSNSSHKINMYNYCIDLINQNKRVLIKKLGKYANIGIINYRILLYKEFLELKFYKDVFKQLFYLFLRFIDFRYLFYNIKIFRFRFKKNSKNLYNG